MMIDDVEFESQMHPFKFLGLFECTTRNIVALLVGIASVLSFALVNYAKTVQKIMDW